MDRDRLTRRHADLTRWLWGLVPGVVLFAVTVWSNWTFLSILWALLFAGGLFYYLFLLFRGVWRGWKGDER